MSLTGIRETPLSLDEVMNAVERPEAGAVASFRGVVRNHNEGLGVTQLDYHCYEAMANKEMAAIAAEIEAEIDNVKVACLHRVGILEVGDAAVVCAASSPHRAEAFRACRELIDRVKARVPIWKREHGEGGPHWVGWKDARIGAEGARDESGG